MKKPEKKYFKNCVLKFTETTRNFDGTFNYFQKKIEDCYIILTEGKKTIEYIVIQGGFIKHSKKRGGNLKYTGRYITETDFQQCIRDEKFNVYEFILSIDDSVIKEKRLIDYETFSKIKL